MYDALGGFGRSGLGLGAFSVTPAANPVTQILDGLPTEGLPEILPVPPDLRGDVLAAGAQIGRNNAAPAPTSATPATGRPLEAHGRLQLRPGDQTDRTMSARVAAIAAGATLVDRPP